MYWIWIGVFFANLLLSFIPANMARNKGYRFGWFWALSAFLVSFLIGIAIVLCLKRRPVDKQKSGTVRTNIFAPSSEPLPYSFLVPMSDPPLPSYKPSRHTGDSKFCSKCGKQMAVDSERCDKCESDTD